MCLFSEKWVCKQVLNDHNLLCSLQCKKTFWSFDDSVKSSAITEKDGAYVSLESEIIRYIKYHVNPETDKIKINISGDGSKVSRISNFVVLSFSGIIDVWHYHQQIKMFFAL
jgi:hypothetical protein